MDGFDKCECTNEVSATDICLKMCVIPSGMNESKVTSLHAINEVVGDVNAHSAPLFPLGALSNLAGFQVYCPG